MSISEIRNLPQTTLVDKSHDPLEGEKFENIPVKTSTARKAANQFVKFVARVLIFTVALAGGAILGNLIPIPGGVFIGGAMGFAFGMAAHNKAMNIINNWIKP